MPSFSIYEDDLSQQKAISSLKRNKTHVPKGITVSSTASMSLQTCSVLPGTAALLSFSVLLVFQAALMPCTCPSTFYMSMSPRVPNYLSVPVHSALTQASHEFALVWYPTLAEVHLVFTGC